MEDEVSNKDKAGRTPLHNAVIEQHYETVESLLAKKEDPNTEDNNGVTPLIVAVQNCRSNAQKDYDVVSLLLANNADINKKNSQTNESALAWASFDNDLKLVELLLAEGAVLNCCCL